MWPGTSTRSASPHATPVAAGHPAWGTARFRAVVDGHGSVVIDVHGREAQDAQAFQRMWHAAMDKQGSGRERRSAGVNRPSTRHLCSGLAQRAEVPVPTLVAVGAVGAADDGYVVVADNDARPWQTLDPQEVDDDLLRSVWQAVKACHQAGLAHNLLDAQAIEVLADGSVQLTDWFVAQPAASDPARDHDVATALMTTAAKVGAKRAVATAIDVVGPDTVTAALPLCQLGVLDRRSRHDVDKHTAADVRTEAAAALDVTEPDLAELHRVSRSDLLLIGGSVLGFWLLYKQLASLGDVWSTLANAAWAWVALVLVLGQVAVIFTAVGLRGAVVQKLALGRVIALEYADQFTGLVGGTVAITATNIRFFQRQGLSGATAVTSGVTSSLAGGVIQVTIIVVSLPFLISNDQLHLNNLGGDSGGGHVVVIALIAVALVSGIVTLVPRFRSAVAHKVKPEIHKARDELRDILHRPRNLLTMLGGQLGAQLAFALALGASLHAYGGSLPIIQLLVINTFASLIGGLAPVPGGMGAIEAGLIAGFTAFGVDATLAGAATFTYRLFTAYLPPAWGWPTLTWLRKRDLL